MVSPRTLMRLYHLSFTRFRRAISNRFLIMISSFEMNYVKGKRGKKKDQTSYPYLRTFVEFSCLTKQTTIKLHFITPCSSASSLHVNAGTQFCLAIETSVMDHRNNTN